MNLRFRRAFGVSAQSNAQSSRRTTEELVKVADRGDLEPGQMKLVQVRGYRIVLANVDGVYYAFDAICPHSGGPLDQGELKGEVITCPWHMFQFNVRTGASLVPSAGLSLQTYPVKVEGEEVKMPAIDKTVASRS